MKERSWLSVAGIWKGAVDDLETAIEAGRRRSRNRALNLDIRPD
ncbi:hypothetical protein [Halobaculum sp. CBA1158]|nr:hypothetical protein [Halobaculum sp. CBA1158]